MSPFPQLDLHRLWIVADLRPSYASMNPLFLNPPFLQRPRRRGFPLASGHKVAFCVGSLINRSRSGPPPRFQENVQSFRTQAAAVGKGPRAGFEALQLTPVASSIASTTSTR
jgi:hypothetical protein